ncbi:MAG: hypothetical protein ACO25T_01195 [Arenimonas sp.]|uniref:hypothetical protein n=1 Tax=Arenimonas sp. TaxID=1872635 RepID=UPI003C086CC3
MSNSPNITLDLRLGYTPDAGWTHVTATNGSLYSYKYAGGDDGAGGMQAKAGRGNDTANVQLIADGRYTIFGVVFQNDSSNQLSWNGNGNRAGNIVDQNTAVENAEYSVLITDTGNGNTVFVCDPPVKNVPQ